jgi:hypothetical protein
LVLIGPLRGLYPVQNELSSSIRFFVELWTLSAFISPIFLCPNPLSQQALMESVLRMFDGIDTRFQRLQRMNEEYEEER